MCIFTGPVRQVESTKIFARFLRPGRQCLIYAMAVGADADVAMVLPIPIAPGAAEDSVAFVDLEDYPKLFEDIHKLFPVLLSGAPPAPVPRPQSIPLVVHQVGAFEASFVPSVPDFARLDPRFRLGDDVWRRLPQYSDWGFVVFKLRNLGADVTTKIHPMAFEFDSRVDLALFFPTVHVHDGHVHDHAAFAHNLYFQLPAQGEPGYADMRDATRVCTESASDVASSVDLERAKGLVAPSRPFYRRTFFGQLPNGDVWAHGEMLPTAANF